MTNLNKLSRRERQIMDVLYRLEQASAKEIQDALGDPLSDSSIRTFLRKLEEKGHIKHREAGPKFIYSPIVARNKASASALSNVVKTFFSDSPLMAVNSLLDMSMADISEDDIKSLEKLIREKKQELNKK
ncbi:MAG: BlaI/MecI/CopY family transcriptional regulator [Gammaproteobacteria bacterium]